MKTKSRLIILDSDVIIHLHQLEIWDQFIAAYKVYVCSTVIEECTHYEALDGHYIQGSIDLSAAVKDEKIFELSLDASDLSSLSKRLRSFGGLCLDPGEAETIGLILQGRLGDTRLCIADHAAIKGAVFLDMGDVCISLESALNDIGLLHSAKHHPKGRFRHQFTNQWLTKIIQSANSEKVQYTKL